MGEKRIEFDFELEFTNGGGLTGSGFRLDVPHADVSDDWLAQALVRDLRLLMVGPVRLTGVMRNLAVNADLRLPDGGQLAVRGRVDVASRTKSYDLAVGMRVVNLNTVVAKAPRTSCTSRRSGWTGCS